MSDLAVLDETYARIGDLPVTVCVLTLPGNVFWVGVSHSPLERFDADVARANAYINAVRSAKRAIAEARMPAAYLVAARALADKEPA